jgi:hypothetical protein
MADRCFLILFWCLSVAQEMCSPENRNSEYCLIQGLDTEERLRDAFDASPVSYRVIPEYLTSQLPPYERDLTLCTQGSMDRLDRLFEQATSWHGSLSVALYLAPSEVEASTYESALSRIRKLHSDVESQGRCRLTISLLYGIKDSEANVEYDTL